MTRSDVLRHFLFVWLYDIKLLVLLQLQKKSFKTQIINVNGRLEMTNYALLKKKEIVS